MDKNTINYLLLFVKPFDTLTNSGKISPMPKYITHSKVVAQIDAHIARAGSQHALAKEWGLSGAYLSRVRAGKQSAGPKICRHLGVVPVLVYVVDGD